MAVFAKIAIFAKIANLQGATFGIQFKSPAAGDFSPVSPFSPLHAFLDISVLTRVFYKKMCGGFCQAAKKSGRNNEVTVLPRWP